MVKVQTAASRSLGSELPVEGGHGGVVAPIEGGEPGLDCARWRRSWQSAARRCVLDDRGAAGVRDPPYDRALRAPRSRRQARDDGRATHSVSYTHLRAHETK